MSEEIIRKGIGKRVTELAPSVSISFLRWDSLRVPGNSRLYTILKALIFSKNVIKQIHENAILKV